MAFEFLFVLTLLFPPSLFPRSTVSVTVERYVSVVHPRHWWVYVEKEIPLPSLFGKLDQNTRFIAYLYELHGPNFSEGLHACTASGTVKREIPLQSLQAGVIM